MDSSNSNSSSIPYRGRTSVGFCCNYRTGYRNWSNARIQTMIQFIVGLLIVMGSVGGIETASDASLYPLVVLAGVGLYLMHIGVKRM